MLVCMAVSFAQLPDGSVAPNFVATDLNGKVWNLHQVLEEDKIVVLFFTTTWCLPCWSYQKSEALQDLYELYGPNGSQELEVFFVESDPATNAFCLYGNAGCNNFTFGDWTAGVTYPMINNYTIAQDYEVGYYPTLYVICPNKKLFKVDQLNTDELWQKAQSCPVAYGNNNAGLFNYDPGPPYRELCLAQLFKPAVHLVNLGTDSLRSAALELRWNSTPLQTIQWNGALGTYGEQLIAFDSFYRAGTGTLEVQLSKVNNKPDDQPANNFASADFTASTAFKSHAVLLKLRTDQFGGELYWDIRDDQDQVLAWGGNQTVGPNGGGQFPLGAPPDPNAYGNEVFVKDTIFLPEDGCYTLHVVDGFGDGICCKYGNGYLRLFDLEAQQTPLINISSFETDVYKRFSAQVPVTAVYAEQPDMPLRCYPNPVYDKLYILLPGEKTKPYAIHVYNSMGSRMMNKTVFAGTTDALDVGLLPNGWYVLQVMDDSGRPVGIHRFYKTER